MWTIALGWSPSRPDHNFTYEYNINNTMQTETSMFSSLSWFRNVCLSGGSFRLAFRMGHHQRFQGEACHLLFLLSRRTVHRHRVQHHYKAKRPSLSVDHIYSSAMQVFFFFFLLLFIPSITYFRSVYII